MIKKILNFIFPKKCSGCGEFGSNLCTNCLEKFIERDKKHFETEENFSIYSPFVYKKNLILKNILKEIKYSKKFGKFFGLEKKFFLEFKKFLEEKNISSHNIFLIPVPLHWLKFLQRGFNQSELFCDILENNFKKSGGKGGFKKINLLKKIKNTKPQAQSSKIERLANLKNAFEINNNTIHNIRKTKGKKTIFVLIDDVVSTGETMKNCKIELEKNFPSSKVFGFSICSDK